MHKRVGNTALALSRLLNAMLGGNPSETLSGRCYREDIAWGRTAIDSLFFFQPNHCLHSHIDDRVGARDLLGAWDQTPEEETTADLKTMRSKVDQWDWR